MKKQQGIALVTAIFLIVVIGAAVVLLADLAVRNTQQVSQSLLQLRAQQATDAALEATVQRIVNAPNAIGWCNETAAPVSVAHYSDYQIHMTCTAKTYNRPAQQISLFTLRATAEFGVPDNADYVWHELTATVEM